MGPMFWLQKGCWTVSVGIAHGRIEHRNEKSSQTFRISRNCQEGTLDAMVRIFFINLYPLASIFVSKLYAKSLMNNGYKNPFRTWCDCRNSWEVGDMSAKTRSLAFQSGSEAKSFEFEHRTENVPQFHYPLCKYNCSTRDNNITRWTNTVLEHQPVNGFDPRGGRDVEWLSGL